MACLEGTHSQGSVQLGWSTGGLWRPSKEMVSSTSPLGHAVQGVPQVNGAGGPREGFTLTTLYLLSLLMAGFGG